MKIKDLMKILETHDPENNVMIFTKKKERSVTSVNEVKSVGVSDGNIVCPGFTTYEESYSTIEVL